MSTTTSVVQGPPKDFLLEVSLGNVPGFRQEFVAGSQGNLEIADGEITLWDSKFQHTPISGDTELFISSSNAGDTMLIAASGLDANFDRKSSFVALSGQSQVSVGNFTHLQTLTVAATTVPAGDIYCAETDTLTAGVPDTDSKVHSKIIQGENVTHNGFYMVPNGDVGVVMGFSGGSDATIMSTKVTPILTFFGGIPLRLSPFFLLTNFPQVIFTTPRANAGGASPTPLLPAKSMFSLEALSAAGATDLTFRVDLLLIDAAFAFKL